MKTGANGLFHGRLSFLGALFAGSGFLGTLVLGTVVLIASSEPNPRLSILAWIVAPAIGYIGVALLVTGARLEQRRRHKAEPDRFPAHFRLDLNQAGTRRAFHFGLLLAVLLIVQTSVSSYQAYRFTESTAFCGSTCHSVMEPERVAHGISPHSRVECASCHVGKTPIEYVQSKLFGLAELYLLTTNKFPRPIPVPIHSMQVVRENCTTCHWERKFWGKMQRDYSHYVAANNNQQWILRMAVKVGGMYRFGGEGEGIHWHMKISPRVSYIATDRNLQKIPWVRVASDDGQETVYRSTEEPIADKDLARYSVRDMTCVDCHSRPAHQFRAPVVAVDDAIALGRIDPTIPEVKTKAVELLAAPGYQTQEQATIMIRDKLLAYYQEKFPEVFRTEKAKLETTAASLSTLYRQNFFPQMKSDWRSYPDNIGHYLSDGCFRCHDGQHVSRDGKAISNDCSLCHDIIEQGPREALESNVSGLAFRHPVDFGTPVSEMGKCTACHDGTLGP